MIPRTEGLWPAPEQEEVGEMKEVARGCTVQTGQSPGLTRVPATFRDVFTPTTSGCCPDTRPRERGSSEDKSIFPSQCRKKFLEDFLKWKGKPV